MKKIISLLLALLLVATMITGCKKNETADNSSDVSSADNDWDNSDNDGDDWSDSDNDDDDWDNSDNDDDDNWNDIDNDDDDWDNSDNDDDDNWNDGDNDDDDWDNSDNDDDDDWNDGDNDDDDDDYNASAAEERKNDVLAGEDEQVAKDGLYRLGNLDRLAKAMRKAQKGETVTIAFYGGSNVTTFGNFSGDAAGTPYPLLVQKWWNTNFGECEIITKGRAAFNSVGACLRVDNDVLQYEPDIVFLDFAVQDAYSGMQKTNSIAYDNLVRRILNSSNSPAVVSVLLTAATTASYEMNAKNCDAYKSAASYEKKIAEYYDLPVIDAEKSIWNVLFELVEVSEKREQPLIFWGDVATNNTVLNDTGNVMVASMINYLLDTVKGKLSTISTSVKAGKTVGLYAVDKYMKSEFVDVASIAKGEASGYSTNISFDDLNRYGYWAKTDDQKTDLYTNGIYTYRHYAPSANASEEEKTFEEYPTYIEWTIPEVQEGQDTYIVTGNYAKCQAIGKVSSYVNDMCPIQLVYYKADGTSSSEWLDCNVASEFITADRYRNTKVPVGTVRIKAKCYTSVGIVHLLGIGHFE